MVFSEETIDAAEELKRAFDDFMECLISEMYCSRQQEEEE